LNFTGARIRTPDITFDREGTRMMYSMSGEKIPMTAPIPGLASRNHERAASDCESGVCGAAQFYHHSQLSGVGFLFRFFVVGRSVRTGSIVGAASGSSAGSTVPQNLPKSIPESKRENDSILDLVSDSRFTGVGFTAAEAAARALPSTGVLALRRTGGEQGVNAPMLQGRM